MRNVLKFDHKIGTFTMTKISSIGTDFAVIEENVIEGETFYPFVAFFNSTSSANGDQIEFIFHNHYY